MFKRYLILLGCVFVSCFAQKTGFQSKIIGSGFFDETTEIGCFLDNTQIGTIEITRLPFSIYILHSFFVRAEYRNRGYGAELLSRACCQVEAKKPRSVLIQPGPFEITHEGPVHITDPNERKEKTIRLARLYRKFGFETVSKPVCLVVAVLYKIIGLPEDARYLMVQ